MISTTPRFTIPSSDAPPPASGRDSNGRFTQGNAGGPGNPYARQVAALRRALLQLVTEEEITAIAKALLEQAKKGNVSAAKLLFSYTLGQPAKAVDPDRLPEHELNTLNANYAEPEEVTALLNRQSLEDFLPVIQIAMACQQQQVKDHVADRLTQAVLEDQKQQQQKEKRQARRAGAAGGPRLAATAAEAGPKPAPAPSANGDNGAQPATPTPPAAPSANGTKGAAPAKSATAPSANGSNGAPPATPTAPPGRVALQSLAAEAMAAFPEPPSTSGDIGPVTDGKRCYRGESDSPTRT
jgi:hypothetical protein